MWLQRPGAAPRGPVTTALIALVALGAGLGGQACALPTVEPGAGTVGPPRAEDLVSLGGLQRFRAGDDAAWAAPDLDDAGWPLLAVPGDLDAGHLSPRGVGWYRLRFQLPPGLGAGGDAQRPRALAVNLGRLRSADRAFLNGHRVGGCGVFGPWGVECPGGERVYPLPARWLRAGDNVLAVRVQGAPGLATGIIGGAPRVGPRAALTVEAARGESARETWEALGLGLFLAAWLFITALLGGHRREVWWVWLFVTTYVVLYVLESEWIARAGIMTPWLQHVDYALTGALPGLALVVVERGALGGDPRGERLARAGLWVFGALGLALLTPLPYGAARWVGWLWGALLVGAVAVALGWVVEALRRGRPGARLLAAGTAGLVVSALTWLAKPTVAVVGGGVKLEVLDLAMLVFIVTVELNLARRFVWVERELRLALEAVAHVQARERARMARELHDGLTQDLAALRLLLQAGEAKAPPGSARGALGEAAARVGELVDEVRSVSHNLHPIVSGRGGLRPALERLAADAGRAGAEPGGSPSGRAEGEDRRGQGATVEVVVDETLALPERVEDQLYRVAQEAVRNATRHGRASHVVITVEGVGGAAEVTKRAGGEGGGDAGALVAAVRMSVVDDGVGFEPGRAATGLGLRTIRERATLVGGWARVWSKPGRGARVEVEVPL